MGNGPLPCHHRHGGSAIGLTIGSSESWERPTITFTTTIGGRPGPRRETSANPWVATWPACRQKKNITKSWKSLSGSGSTGLCIFHAGALIKSDRTGEDE